MEHLIEIISPTISVIALLVSLLAFLENRRGNRLGKTPALFGLEHEGPNDYFYVIANKGNGPACFEKIEYFLDKKPLFDKTFREALTKVLAETGIRFNLTVTHPAQGNVMRPGEELMLVKVVVPPDCATALKAIPADRFAVRIVFKSIYGRRSTWASDDSLR